MRPWQSVTPAAIRRRGTLRRKKTDSHDQFANWSRNDKGVRCCCDYRSPLSLRGRFAPVAIRLLKTCKIV